MSECPKCESQLERRYGLPGKVLRCKKCEIDWVDMYGSLVTREEFHERREAER